MSTKRFAALVMAAALAVCAVSGCTLGEKTRIAATYNGGEVPAGVYLYNQVSALNEAYYLVPDMSKDLLSQQIDGIGAEEWINNRAAELTRAYVAIESEFDRLGLTLDSGTAAAATQGLEQNWDSQKDQLEKAGIGYASVEASLLNAAKAELLFTAYYGEGGEFEVPEEEYRAFYEENFRRVLLLVFSKTYDPVAGAAFDEEGAAAQLEKIQSYFGRAQAGEDLYSLIVENDRELTLALDSGAEATYQAPTEASRTALIYRDDTSYPEALRDQLFAGDGDGVETYEDDSYGILYQRLSLDGDDTLYESAKSSMLPLMKQDAFVSHLVSVADGMGFALNQDAVKQFTVKKLLEL